MTYGDVNECVNGCERVLDVLDEEIGNPPSRTDERGIDYHELSSGFLKSVHKMLLICINVIESLPIAGA